MTRFVFAVSILAGAALLYWVPISESPRAAVVTTGLAETTPVRPAVDTRSLRLVYPYSVIRGGVYSLEEWREALFGDAIAAAHYADFHQDAARMILAAEPCLMYASYRIGDSIFWTRHRIHIAAGESLITDGENLARGRCGNRLSETPREPVRAADPAESEMDQAKPDLGNSGIASIEKLGGDRSALAFDPFHVVLPPLPLATATGPAPENESSARLDMETFQVDKPPLSGAEDLAIAHLEPPISRNAIREAWPETFLPGDGDASENPIPPVPIEPPPESQRPLPVPETFTGALVCAGIAGMWLRRAALRRPDASSPGVSNN